MESVETSTTVKPAINTKLVPDKISFSHVQMYVDELEDLHVYKELEKKLNEFDAELCTQSFDGDNAAQILEKKQHIWRDMSGEGTDFVSHGRDIVKQLLVGFGFRVTAASYASGNTESRSVLVTSRDPQGIEFVITAALGGSDGDSEIFSAGNFFLK